MSTGTAPQPFRMDDISEARLQDVLPALANRIRNMAHILRSENINIRVIQALRSWTQQDGLFAQGRSEPGEIVTNVRGGYSWHNFGCAVDCAPSVNGVELAYIPDWNERHPSWTRMASVGVGLGLIAGARWCHFKDSPHFQLTGRFPVDAPTDEVRQLFKDGGCEAVWAELEIV